MKTINELIRESLTEVKAAREIRREERIKRVYEEFPELKKLDEEIVNLRGSRFIAVIDGDEPLVKRLDISIEEYQAKRERFIKLNKIDPDFDEEQCICDKCEDTGYTKGSDGTVKVCSCRKKELESSYEFGGMGDYTSYKMKNYRDDYLGDAANRKKIKNQILKVMLGMTDNTEANSLWVYSSVPQTGKTFLAVCVCKTAINLGKGAYYAKCEDLNSIGSDTLEDIKRIDFLVLDDFADSVTLNPALASVLNSILEVRIAAKLQTILVTSFSRSELVSKCDMRISGKLSKAGLISKESR
ncbi:MAG: hypothetical protein MJ084_00870 [Saccharofermentans sp.]|nr:hypothetical protein [Saccharofermentans sp.]